jgi:mitochondrial fission protein ELM1
MYGRRATHIRETATSAKRHIRRTDTSQTPDTAVPATSTGDLDQAGSASKRRQRPNPKPSLSLAARFSLQIGRNVGGDTNDAKPLTFDDRAPKSPLMSDIAAPWVISEGLAGLHAQAIGLAEAAGLSPDLRVLRPHAPWKWIAAKLWPDPLAAVADTLTAPWPKLAIGCGGMAGAVLAALRRHSMRVVQVQNPRMDIRRFDLIIANHHDELSGPNVFVIRTALHRVNSERLAAAAGAWQDRFVTYKRPLVAVLLGGSNGRYRLDLDAGAKLASDLVAMAQRDKVGIVVTPSRRTDPAITGLIRQALAPVGGYVWDFTGDNPYFGMLALADMVVVTQDSVSMISEAAATSAPVMFAPLPGSSRRQGIFLRTLMDEDRIRPFEGRFSTWPVTPLNDTPAAAAEMRHRLGFSGLGL